MILAVYILIFVRSMFYFLIEAIVIEYNSFQHLVSLDISHNNVEVLVVSALRGLRELRASHNALQHIALHGASLRILYAPYNRMSLVKIISK